MASWRSLPPKLICLQEIKWGKRTHLKCKLNPYASCPISSASWHSYTLWIEISRVLVSIWTAGLGEKSWQRKEQSVREQKQCLILQSVYSFGKYKKKNKKMWQKPMKEASVWSVENVQDRCTCSGIFRNNLTFSSQCRESVRASVPC